MLYPPIAQFLSMAKFRVECLTHAHSRARPVPSLTSSGYGLPPTAIIPFRRLINVERPSRLEPRISLTGTCGPTTRSPTFYRLSYGLRDRQCKIKMSFLHCKFMENHNLLERYPLWSVGGPWALVNLKLKVRNSECVTVMFSHPNQIFQSAPYLLWS